MVPLAGGTRRRRRRGFTALAVVIALGIMGPAPAASGQEHGHDGMLPPGDWTAEQRAVLHDMIERAEAELPAFSDPASLPALGFYNFGVTAPGGWDHWINTEWMSDDHILDPTRPESLVYRSTAEGWKLEAAMYFLPPGNDMTTIPHDLAWLPGWHQHPELCLTPDGRYAGQVDGNGNCFSGAPSDLPPMMHVWIVDPGCGHRFGGVGVSGLNCDVSHHHPTDPPHPTHPEPPTTPTAPTPPGGSTPGPTTSTTVDILPQPGHVPADPAAPPVATPALPVRAQPSYVG
jgi:hypothetical protein